MDHRKDLQAVTDWIVQAADAALMARDDAYREDLEGLRTQWVSFAPGGATHIEAHKLHKIIGLYHRARSQPLGKATAAQMKDILNQVPLT